MPVSRGASRQGGCKHSLPCPGMAGVDVGSRQVCWHVKPYQGGISSGCGGRAGQGGFWRERYGMAFWGWKEKRDPRKAIRLLSSVKGRLQAVITNLSGPQSRGEEDLTVAGACLGSTMVAKLHAGLQSGTRRGQDAGLRNPS